MLRNRVENFVRCDYFMGYIKKDRSVKDKNVNKLPTKFKIYNIISEAKVEKYGYL